MPEEAPEEALEEDIIDNDDDDDDDDDGKEDAEKEEDPMTALAKDKTLRLLIFLPLDTPEEPLPPPS